MGAVYVMSGRRLRACIRQRCRPRRGRLRLLVGGCALAFADTIEWALVQAYQNNPSLNAQRASLRATDENVPQALSGYRPKVSATATAGFNYSSTQSRTSISQSAFPNTDDLFEYRRRFRFAQRRRHGVADALQRQSDRQQNAPGRKPGDGRARDIARHRAAGAARRGHRLYGFAARRGDARSAAQQRRSPHRTAQTDARPLQCRRSDAHRRRAGRIAARGRPLPIARRAVAIRDVAGAISARHRRRSRASSPPARRWTGFRRRRCPARSLRARRKARRCSPPCTASISPNSR